MSILIKLNNVSKNYHSLKRNGFSFKWEIINILNKVNLEINSKEVFGLIGHNGSGKTTLLKIISGLLLADSGEILFDNQKYDFNTHKVGYVNNNFRSFYWRLTGRQNLDFFSSLTNLSKSESREKICFFSNYFGIEEKLDKKFMFYSSGEMQYLSIIRSLLADPKLLLLDEPSSSLDPLNREKLIRLSKTYLLEEGITCIWCTHNLDELDQVCENFGIMSEGKIKVFKDLNEKDTLCESYTFKVLSKDLKKLDSNNFNYDLISKEEKFVQIKINSNGMSLNTCLKFFLKRDIKIFSIDKNYFKKEIKKKLFEQ